MPSEADRANLLGSLAIELGIISPQQLQAVLEEQAQDTTWRHLRADQITYVGAEPEQR